jgi:DNA modification methylase
MSTFPLEGDCLDTLRGLDSNSVDAIVTDPPYGLAEHKPAALITALTAWANGDREHVPDGKGFMGRDWDAFVPPPAVWDECLRVLKPGGHLLAFAGSRTADLMGLSVRMAGFEIRDTIMWVYGSGFPKSLDVSKAIDKAAGASREVVGTGKTGGLATAFTGNHRANRDAPDAWRDTHHQGHAFDITVPATDEATRWQGWGTALKPAQEPIIVARKPLSGTVAATVLAHGTGALNIDGCRVNPGSLVTGGGGYAAHKVDATEGWDRPYVNGVTRAEGHTAGRWPSNVVLTHAPDCVEGGACVAGCPVADLDQQSGTSKSPGTYTRSTIVENHIYGASNDRPVQHGHGDSGGASRFFPVFRYQAKAPSRERPEVDGVKHPTVKPLALMQWLVRLVTPPGGIVLDPFAGSGTTLEAARAEGFDSIGIERDPAYYQLILRRLGYLNEPAEVAS